MKTRLAVLFMAGAFLASFGLFAATTPATGIKDVKTSIAEKTSLTAEKLTELKTKYGYGEIMVLSEIAKKSSQPLDTILSEKNSGMNFTDLSKKYNLKLTEITKTASTNLMDLNKEHRNNPDLRQAKAEIRKIERENMKATKKELRAERKEMRKENKMEHKAMKAGDTMGQKSSETLKTTDQKASQTGQKIENKVDNKVEGQTTNTQPTNK